MRARRDNPCQEVTGGKDQWRTVAQQEDEAEVLAVYGDGSVDVRFEDGEKMWQHLPSTRHVFIDPLKTK